MDLLKYFTLWSIVKCCDLRVKLLDETQNMIKYESINDEQGRQCACVTVNITFYLKLQCIAVIVVENRYFSFKITSKKIFWRFEKEMKSNKLVQLDVLLNWSRLCVNMGSIPLPRTTNCLRGIPHREEECGL